MLVGRDEHLAALADALAGDSPVVLVGEGGIGKTTLLRTAAAASGRRSFVGGALSTLSWLPYLPIERALRRRITVTDRTQVAAEVETAVGDGVLVLDDLQWAATATLDAVRLLAGRIGLLTAVRRGDAGSDAALAALDEARFTVVELPALTDSDALTLLHDLRPGLRGAGARRLLARAGGNPLLIRELSATGEPSESLRLALAARLRRVDDAGRAAFRVLAVAGRPLLTDVLGKAGVASLLRAELAVLAGDEVEVRHALLAEVAIEQMNDEERQQAHRRVAELAADDGEAAHHLTLAGDRDAAFARARRAADTAQTPGERATHLAVAAGCADGPDADTLRLEAASALADAQDWPALSALLSQFDTDDPTARATAALMRARAAWHAGDPDDLRAAVHAGLALVGDTDSDIAVRLRIEACRLPIFVDADPDAAVAATEEALTLAAGAGVDVARARYLHGTALYIAQRGGTAEVLTAAIDAARAEGDIGTEMLAANNLVVFHESAGDPSAAQSIAAGFVNRARELGLGVWERSFRIALSNLDFHGGRYDDVLRAADELLDLSLERRTRESLLEQQCLSLIDIGRIDEAVRRIAVEPDRPDDWTWHRQVLWVSAEAALWGGQPQQALQHATAILGGPAGDANVVFAHVTRGWALHDLGRSPVPVLDEELPAMLSAVPHEVSGIAALAAGEPATAMDAFDRATKAWSGYHRRGEVRCAWAGGEAARRAHAADALDRLLEAERQASEHRMAPLLARIHRSLRSLGVRRAAPARPRRESLLSAREREVLRLVAGGLSNAEIAARLAVSRHTVVTQIASASAKLGATGRNHAAMLAGQLERSA